MTKYLVKLVYVPCPVAVEADDKTAALEKVKERYPDYAVSNNVTILEK